MEFQNLFLAVGFMIGLGAVLSGFLVLANKKLAVHEDPRIGNVEEMLPGSNCGACGQPGCRAFAEEVVTGREPLAQCTVSTPESLEEIAGFLGVGIGTADKKIARLACAGGTNVARQRVRYEGLKTCLAASIITGGGKGCVWGCLGHGDCADVCDFDAITMDDTGLPIVIEDKCTACGDCVDICPKDLFSLESIGNKLWVACKNEAAGDSALRECDVACTACGLCAADASAGLITMKKNLPAIDYERIASANTECIERCPTGAIVWLSDTGSATKGKKAKRIIRRKPLPIG
jgi:Na+-translocating ferredoxin:NAD+ oxidoreductase RNF subunit RnfB